MYDIRKTPEFDAWLNGLRDSLTRQRLVTRLRKVSLGNFGDVSPVSEGVWEMREHFGSGWRMYYIEKSGALILMLGGGDKSDQDRDVRRAKKLAKEWE